MKPGNRARVSHDRIEPSRIEAAHRAKKISKAQYDLIMVFDQLEGDARTYDKAAAQLSMPVGTLKSRLHRARAGIRSFENTGAAP